MTRLGALAGSLVVALCLSSCGATLQPGDGQPEPGDVGAGFTVPPTTGGDAGQPSAGAGSAPAGQQPAPPVPSPDDDSHPRTAGGDTVLNATEADVDGFHLRFAIDGELAYAEGDTILFELKVRNDTGTEAWFDADARSAVVVDGHGGERAWSHPGCLPDFGDDHYDTGPTLLSPGQEIQLLYRYTAEERYRGRHSCWLPPGTWQATGRFALCPPDQMRVDEGGNRYCADGGLRWVAAPPLVFDVT